MAARLYELFRLDVPPNMKGDLMNMVRYSIDDLPPLTKKQQDSLKHLAALSDDDINLSDIPEVSDWSDAVRGGISNQSFSAEACLVRPSIVHRG